MNVVHPFLSGGLYSNCKECYVQNKNKGYTNVTKRSAQAEVLL